MSVEQDEVKRIVCGLEAEVNALVTSWAGELIAKAVAQEREECALVAEQFSSLLGIGNEGDGRVARNIASLIRERGRP
jgi:hypothetical protein